MNLANITLHNDKADYSPLEFEALKEAYDSLEEKAQGGILSLEETRIRIAYCRYYQEDHFRIYQPNKPAKKGKKVKEASSVEDMFAMLSGEEPQAKVRKPRAKKETVSNDPMKKAAKLFALKEKGEILSEEDEEFLLSLLNAPVEGL